MELKKIEALILSEIDKYNAESPDEPISMKEVVRHLMRTNIVLRDNQMEPVRLGIDYFKKAAEVQDGAHFRPALIVAPTAFGKSILIAKIVEGIDDKILILQPNKELLEQNFIKYAQFGNTGGIYSASFNSKQIYDVTYATIGSIYKQGQAFKAMGFTKIIIDECHLYSRKIGSMTGKFLKDSEITHVLGLTATPMQLQQLVEPNGTRSAGLQMLTNRAYGHFFKDILHVTQIEDMVKHGYWTPLEYESRDVDMSLLKYTRAKDDYTNLSMDIVYKINDTCEKIVRKLAEIPDRKSIVVFVHSVEAALQLERMVGRETSAAIYGLMPTAERTKAIADFRNGKIRVVFNVNVLSHGFDYADIDCIITARATASFSLYYQQLGRGVRISDRKKNCLIIDFSGNIKKFGRVEDLVFKKDDDNKWELYNDGKLLTGIPLHKIGTITDGSGSVMPIGKYAGTQIKDLPEKYKKKMMETFKWTKDTLWIREEIIGDTFT